MNDDERLQQHIRQRAGLQALKQIRAVVDQDLAEQARKQRLLRGLLRYGLPLLLLLAGLLGYWWGVW